MEIRQSVMLQIEEAARKEGRSAAEVLEEAAEIYLHRKRLVPHYAYGEAKTRELGLTEEDVPRSIEAVRREGHGRL